jgi:hypothetical protein
MFKKIILKRSFLLFFNLLLCWVIVNGQRVTQVDALQTDKVIRINYMLEGSQKLDFVNVYYKCNDEDWKRVTQLSGDTANIAPGNHELVWHVLNEMDALVCKELKIKIEKRDTKISNANKVIEFIDFELKEPLILKFNYKPEIGSYIYEDIGYSNFIVNPQSFIIEGEIDYYPTILLYFGGDKFNGYNGAFCVKIDGKLNNSAFYVNHIRQNYRIHDFMDLKTTVSYGFIKNEKFEVEHIYKLPNESSKDWQKIQFRFMHENNLISFKLNPKNNQSINAIFSLKPNFDFVKSFSNSSSIFSIRYLIQNVFPEDDAPIRQYYWDAVYLNKFFCKSFVPFDSPLYEKISPSFNNYKNVVDYLQLLRNDKKFNFDKQTSILEIDRRCELIPESKILPAKNLFIEYEQDNIRSINYANPKEVSCLSLQFADEDLITSSKNGEAFAKKNSLTLIQKENTIYIPLERYKRFKILFKEKSVLFFDNDIFQGSIDFENQLAPITIAAFNRKDRKISLKKLTLNALN